MPPTKPTPTAAQQASAHQDTPHAAPVPVPVPVPIVAAAVAPQNQPQPDHDSAAEHTIEHTTEPHSTVAPVPTAQPNALAHTASKKEKGNPFVSSDDSSGLATQYQQHATESNHTADEGLVKASATHGDSVDGLQSVKSIKHKGGEQPAAPVIEYVLCPLV